MVRELVGMGARGIILEDQRWPKRCGHMRGKAVIDAEEHVAKIEAAGDLSVNLRRGEASELPLVDGEVNAAFAYRAFSFSSLLLLI